MKKIYLVSIMLGLAILMACNSRENGNKVIYEYEEEKVELNADLKNKMGPWVEKGVVCFGLVVALDNNGSQVSGKSVKAKIVGIKSDGVKMKALESVSVGEGLEQGCTKMGISRGDTWWETEGDLFQTKEEADSFLKAKGLLK